MKDEARIRVPATAVKYLQQGRVGVNHKRYNSLGFRWFVGGNGGTYGSNLDFR